MIRKIFSSISIIAVLFGTIGFNPATATAAQLTGVKDTLSTVTVNSTATHVITATLAGSNTFTTGDTIVYDFVNADFTLNAIGNWQTSDFSFNDGTARTILAVSSVSGTPPTCTTNGANNVCVTIDTTNNTFTVFPTSSGFVASGAAATTTFTINGTTASGTGTMTNKSSDVDSSAFSITETSDSASGAVVAETNGTVNVTATIAPTLTFSNDDNTIGFGTLTSGAARWANGAATGSASTTTAHTMTVGTNATTGYTLTYNGALLTSGSNTIAAATITGDNDGTPGSNQFGLGVTVTGTGTASSGYETASNNYNFVAGAATQAASATGPVNSDSIAVRYLVNIAASKAAGSYATNLDWVVTGNF
jgi:hypothetical protein